MPRLTDSIAAIAKITVTGRDTHELHRYQCRDYRPLGRGRAGEWGIPITHEQFVRAKAGDWSAVPTPTKPVPADWFPELEGIRVLGLAAGGGQQMPIFAARGAVCTVLDYSRRQIETERMVAEREGYEIECMPYA